MRTLSQRSAGHHPDVNYAAWPFNRGLSPPPPTYLPTVSLWSFCFFLKKKGSFLEKRGGPDPTASHHANLGLNTHGRGPAVERLECDCVSNALIWQAIFPSNGVGDQKDFSTPSAVLPGSDRNDRDSIWQRLRFLPPVSVDDFCGVISRRKMGVMARNYTSRVTRV